MSENTHLGETQQEKNDVPPPYEAVLSLPLSLFSLLLDDKTSTDDSELALPDGWLSELDPVTHQHVFVNSRSNPPVRLSRHPLLDGDFVLSLSAKERHESEKLASELTETPSSCGPGEQKAPSRSPSRLVIQVHTSKPWLGRKTITFRDQDGPTYADFWQLVYSGEREAKLLRVSGPLVKKALPVRHLAKMRFPEFIFQGCGPDLLFEPHEDEIKRRRRHATPTHKRMTCTGKLTTIYALDLPALGNASCEWRATEAVKENVRDGGIFNDGQLSTEKASARVLEDETITPLASGSNSRKGPGWTPFSKQQFVQTTNERVLASYVRASPWAKQTGVLEIFRSGYGIYDSDLADEVVESIVISCAAMIGMQDEMGVLGTLIESGLEAMTGKGKDRVRVL